jgi:hypothetical protein
MPSFSGAVAVTLSWVEDGPFLPLTHHLRIAPTFYS